MEPSDLLNDVERFLAETGMTPTAFGKAALKDPLFVSDLRAGREPRRKTRQRALEFIAEYKARAA